MTISTITAGLLITVVTVALELLDRDYQKEKEAFEK